MIFWLITKSLVDFANYEVFEKETSSGAVETG